MRNDLLAIVGVVAAALAGCAGQSQEYTMQQPAGQQPSGQRPQAQLITFPNGTVFGAASAREASSLAQIMVDANNNDTHHHWR